MTLDQRYRTGEIVRLAREGDLGCRRVIADAGRAIGKAAATLVNVLNPELPRGHMGPVWEALDQAVAGLAS